MNATNSHTQIPVPLKRPREELDWIKRNLASLEDQINKEGRRLVNDGADTDENGRVKLRFQTKLYKGLLKNYEFLREKISA